MIWRKRDIIESEVGRKIRLESFVQVLYHM